VIQATDSTWLGQGWDPEAQQEPVQNSQAHGENEDVHCVETRRPIAPERNSEGVAQVVQGRVDLLVQGGHQRPQVGEVQGMYRGVVHQELVVVPV